VRQAGGDPTALSGRLVREMMQTALRLIPDKAHTGELKLMARSFRELRYALRTFRAYGEHRKVSIFGSARTPTDHPDYTAAVEYARLSAEKDWMVITGAGGGIMRAGHEGAGRAKSFGVSIRLPFEVNANDIIHGDEKLVTFRYFFTRKLIFVSQADALALFPGGFGTLDEGFEVLTLVQTGKTPMIPIILVEPPGSTYWEQFDHYVKTQLLARALISPSDLNLYRVFHTAKAGVEHMLAFYTNYHSSRYVGDRLVIRMNHPLTDKQVEHLTGEFKDLIVEGVMEQSHALPEETDALDLPRLTFIYTKRTYGRLRALIDRLNQYAGAPQSAGGHAHG
jgi:hypothetical protein